MGKKQFLATSIYSNKEQNTYKQQKHKCDWIPLLLVISSFAQLRPTLCDPMDCSTPVFPVPHHLPKFAQIHVHWVSDAIYPSHLLLSPSTFAFNLLKPSLMAQMVKNLPVNAGNLGLTPEEGNGSSLQYFCLENSMDRGAWWATVHTVGHDLETKQLC